MADTLRQRQKRVAREAILDATADEIIEKGLENLSLQEVAARAGVSGRTLYNYFDSREDLLAELLAWSDQRTLELGGSLVPDGLDTLPETVRAVWRTWDAQGNVYLAAGKVEAATQPGKTSGRLTRAAALHRAVADFRPDLADGEQRELAVLFHALAGSAVFQRMTIEDGVDPDRAAALIEWSLTVLRDALAEGAIPIEPDLEEGAP